jgi:hypothetical protein
MKATAAAPGGTLRFVAKNELTDEGNSIDGSFRQQRAKHPSADALVRFYGPKVVPKGGGWSPRVVPKGGPQGQTHSQSAWAGPNP